MRPHDSSEEWWTVFHRASALRDRLREVEQTLQREEKRAALEEIRRETFALLSETRVPQPLKMLVLDLIGGSHLAVDDWPATKTALARIEAKQPDRIGDRKLAKLLRDQTGENKDPTQIKRWREDQDYQFLVWRFRQDEGGH